ncbi:hypothetical protein R3I93_003263 [Phoxinus phoxinus]|uniref:AIG1-type G domain-containing protein n=1 Tax=Phoxinus phoxinus TaxID=58324 RepID=A0AAN9DJM4_9TELE
MEQKTYTSGGHQCTDVAMIEEPRDELPTITGNTYFILLPGKNLKPQEDIIRNALQQISGLQEVFTVAECDVLLVVSIIVSRTGTDIDAAVNELNARSESKPAVFMVLHHTFDPEKIVPDSRRYVTRSNTLTIDLLFNEDEGFLKCVRNNEALEGIKQWLQPEDRRAETEMPKKAYVCETELMLVLLGMPGSEKTAVAHMIFGREESQANASSAALKMITAENGVADERPVAVINTPDWFGSGFSLEKMKQNIKFCTRLASPGPYAFLLVIPANQFIKDESEIVKNMKDVFEESCWERLMLVLTVSDEHEKLKIEKHKFLVEKCGNWFHALNISETGSRPQVSELLKKVEKMVAGNRESSNTSSCIFM